LSSENNLTFLGDFLEIITFGNISVSMFGAPVIIKYPNIITFSLERQDGGNSLAMGSITAWTDSIEIRCLCKQLGGKKGGLSSQIQQTFQMQDDVVRKV